MCIRTSLELSNGSPARPTPYLDLFGNFLQKQINLYVVFLTLSPKDTNMLQIDFQICPPKLKKFIEWKQIVQEGSKKQYIRSTVKFHEITYCFSLSCHRFCWTGNIYGDPWFPIYLILSIHISGVPSFWHQYIYTIFWKGKIIKT